jgi:hypothetical protein
MIVCLGLGGHLASRALQVIFVPFSTLGMMLWIVELLQTGMVSYDLFWLAFRRGRVDIWREERVVPLCSCTSLVLFALWLVMWTASVVHSPMVVWPCFAAQLFSNVCLRRWWDTNSGYIRKRIADEFLQTDTVPTQEPSSAAAAKEGRWDGGDTGV